MGKTGKRPTDLYLDGDILLWKAVSVSNDTWEDEEIFFPDTAIDAYEGLARRWTEIFDNDEEPIHCFTGRTNFRKDIYPLYKADRKTKKKPIGLSKVREWIEDTYITKQHEGIEADDIIGIAMSSGAGIGVSIDKDFYAVPGWYYNPDHMDEPIEIDERDANLNWMRQGLTGDATDNYKGIPGIGPKKAEKIIPQTDTLGRLWGIYLQAYTNAGMTEEEAIVQLQMARILRDGDLQSDGSVQVWTPDTGHGIDGLTSGSDTPVSTGRRPSSSRPASSTQ